MSFKNSKNRYAIQKTNIRQKNDVISSLELEIISLEQQIQETNRALLDAQIVKARSFFSKDRSFLNGIQRRLVETNADKSIAWHMLKLKELKRAHTSKQRDLDRLTGKLWSKRIVRWIILIGLIILFILSSIVIMLGFLAALYILPICILVIIIFSVLKKTKRY